MIFLIVTQRIQRLVFSTARPHNGNTHIAEKAMVNPQNWNGKSAEDDLQNLCATHASNVLDKLHPGENLENLEIKNFFGMSLPNWLGNASFSKMERQTLENLQSCNSLPPLGQLPSLKELAILKLTEVKIIGPNSMAMVQWPLCPLKFCS